MHTFIAVPPSVWKVGASTIFETSSSPFSVALPILDIGVRRLIHRDVLVLADSEASEQILWTKETGSTGSRTLKNNTFSSSAEHGGITTCLTALNINLYWTKERLFLGLPHSHDLFVNLFLYVDLTPWFLGLIFDDSLLSGFLLNSPIA